MFSRPLAGLIVLLADALHSFDGYFHERDDALAHRFAFEAVTGLDSARRTLQDAVLVNARVPGHALAGRILHLVLIPIPAYLAGINILDRYGLRSHAGFLSSVIQRRRSAGTLVTVMIYGKAMSAIAINSSCRILPPAGVTQARTTWTPTR